MRKDRARSAGEEARSEDATTAALPFRMIERLVGAALDLDPETRDSLARFSGAVVDLDITGAGTLRLRIEGDRIRVGPRDDNRAADVSIRGAPLSLLRFALARDREALILDDDVKLSGDIGLATRLQQIAARIDVDVEEALAQRIGDAPAHEFMRAARGFRGWVQDVGSSMLADLSEYMRHEAAMTPLGEEVKRFAQEVDDLRDDVERLDARIIRLQRWQARPK